MAFLQTIIDSICNGFLWVFGAAKKTTHLSPRTYQILHAIVVVLIALLAGYFSLDLPFGKDVVYENEFVRDYFWGILVVLLYAFVRLVLFVISLFSVEDASEFPDIDRAWAEAQVQLGRQGLNLQSFPLFMVVGLPEDQERAFLMGAKFPAVATGPAVDTSQPLRIFANTKAAFLFVPGASAIVRQMTEGPRASLGGGSSIATMSSPGAIGSAGSMMTLSPGQMPSGHSDGGGGGGFGASILGGMSTMAPGAAQGMASGQAPLPMSRPSELQLSGSVGPLSSEALYETERRLRYVCRLISSARKPYCSINGLVTVVPSQWAAEGSQDFSHVVAQDVCVLHEGLEMLFPVACLFSGLESMGGLQEFLSRAADVNRAFSGEVKAGSRFATGRPVDPESASWVTKYCVGWFRDWIYSTFKKNPSSSSNPRLYRLLSEISDRRRSFARLLTGGFGHLIGDQPVRLLGVYFNGRDSQSRSHVFVKQLLDNVLAEQDNVVWSPMRIARDDASRTWTYCVYGVIGLMLVGDVYLAYQRWF